MNAAIPARTPAPSARRIQPNPAVCDVRSAVARAAKDAVTGRARAWSISGVISATAGTNVHNTPARVAAPASPWSDRASAAVGQQARAPNKPISNGPNSAAPTDSGEGGGLARDAVSSPDPDTIASNPAVSRGAR